MTPPSDQSVGPGAVLFFYFQREISSLVLFKPFPSGEGDPKGWTSPKPSPWGEGGWPLGQTDEGTMTGHVRLSRGVRRPGGEVLSQRWESTQRIAGGRGRRALRAHRTAYPRAPVYGGYPLGQTENFRREKSEWRSAIPSGPPGPGFTKISAGAVPLVRLALPSQRSRCKSRREAQGPPLPHPGRVS